MNISLSSHPLLCSSERRKNVPFQIWECCNYWCTYYSRHPAKRSILLVLNTKNPCNGQDYEQSKATRRRDGEQEKISYSSATAPPWVSLSLYFFRDRPPLPTLEKFNCESLVGGTVKTTAYQGLHLTREARRVVRLRWYFHSNRACCLFTSLETLSGSVKERAAAFVLVVHRVMTHPLEPSLPLSADLLMTSWFSSRVVRASMVSRCPLGSRKHESCM